MRNLLSRIKNKAVVTFRHGSALLRLVIAFVYVRTIKRSLLKDDIWLIQEKRTEARDNAYHLYKYIRTQHPEINVFFVISLDSVDIDKVSSLGNLIEYNSFKHFVYYVAARYDIGSQHYCSAPGPGAYLTKFTSLGNPLRKKVFLQHGIIKDMIVGLCHDQNRFDAFCCAGVPEYDFIVSKFGHPIEVPKLVGLCRFDNLPIACSNSKTILIMPTFRMFLNPMDADKKPSQDELNAFINSEFYKTYSGLLNNEEFNNALSQFGYSVIFYLHYSLQAYSPSFRNCENGRIVIATRDKYDVQELLINSSLLVTDYSSVFFDFAYMHKPEIFFQFDEEKYRSTHYSEGYFSYKDNGFGPVCSTVDEVVKSVNNYMSNDCMMELQYRDRLNSFFGYVDTNNCERTFDMVKSL